MEITELLLSIDVLELLKSSCGFFRVVLPGRRDDAPADWRCHWRLVSPNYSVTQTLGSECEFSQE